MYIIYGLLIVLLAIIIYGAVYRKKIYNAVDRLEAWKIEIMNKPVTDEIAKIKGLNMSGETEKKFENWRNNWDEILTLKLPDIEERLFDIEEAANKYRFRTAQGMVNEIKSELQQIEDSLIDMTSEIDQLLHSEEDNRQQIDEVKNLFQSTKNYLLENKPLLGTTAYIFKQQIEEIEKCFYTFETATVEGNYFKAREILLKMKEDLQYERWKMEEVPKILVQVESEIPLQLQELLEGMKEMEEDGYILDYFPFKKDIEAIKTQLVKLLPIIESGNVEAANIPITDIYNEIDQMYEILEQEVLAKQYVIYEQATMKEGITRIQNHYYAFKEELEGIKLSYRIPEEEIKIHLKLEKQIKELVNKYLLIEDLTVNQKQSFLALKKNYEELKVELEDRQETLNQCDLTINTLRKDELKAKETLKELRGRIRQAQRLIKKSNIPGLPLSLINKLEDAEMSLIHANEKMEEIPLVMTDVNKRMETALQSVDEVYDLITFTIEQALTAERMIQYGNRFRSQYSFINEKLYEAEELFRQFEYEESLATAYEAIEEIDPSVGDKVKVNVIEKV